MKRTSTIILILFCIATAGFSQTWVDMAGGLGTSQESVKAIAENPTTHEIYAGGTFTGTINYLAKWNGVSWEQVGTGISGPVYALAFKNQDLYVGGVFSAAGGVTVSNIAKWSGGVWSDVGGGFNGEVRCIYISSSTGKVYAGGTFSLSGSNTMNHVSELVGTTWTQIGTGISSVVNAITEYGTTLYAGCEMSGSPVQKFDGSSWGAVSGISGGKVYALASFANYLYAGGDFSTPTPAAAKFDGTSWSTIQTNFLPTDKIYALSPRFSTVLYIAGKFTNLGIPGAQASYIARINSPTTPIQSITQTGSTLNGEVYAIGNQSGKVVAGGKFTSPGLNISITSSTIGVNELGNMVIEKSFYPNPVSGNAYLKVTTNKILKNPGLKVYDIESRLIEGLTVDLRNNNNELEFVLNCSSLPAGNYYYQLTEDGAGILSDKFVITGE